MASSSSGSGASQVEELMLDTLTGPPPVRERLGNAGSDGLVTMFADAHRLATESFERRIGKATASFERRLTDETSKLRLEMACLKFELLKWSFLFWIGQLAAMTAILSFLLRNVR